MALFGFGSTKQSSQQAQQGVGAQTSYGATDIWGQQIPAFAQMYNQAQRLQLQQQQRAPAAAQGMVNQFMPMMTGAMQGLQGIGAGGSPIEQYAAPNNALAAQQLQAMSGQISQNFAREIMPQLQSGAGLAGGLGQSRHMLAQGVAGGDAARAIADAGTNLYAQQYGIGANAAAAATDARLTAMQGMGQLGTEAYNLGMAPYQAAWAPLQAMSQVMGGPTVLSRQASGGLDLQRSAGSSRGRSTNFSIF